MPIDFKKEQKNLYQPKTAPSIIDVPEILLSDEKRDRKRTTIALLISGDTLIEEDIRIYR